MSNVDFDPTVQPAQSESIEVRHDREINGIRTQISHMSSCFDRKLTEIRETIQEATRASQERHVETSKRMTAVELENRRLNDQHSSLLAQVQTVIGQFGQGLAQVSDRQGKSEYYLATIIVLGVVILMAVILK